MGALSLLRRAGAIPVHPATPQADASSARPKKSPSAPAASYCPDDNRRPYPRPEVIPHAYARAGPGAPTRYTRPAVPARARLSASFPPRLLRIVAWSRRGGSDYGLARIFEGDPT
jgi:hypothetical protein